MNNRLCFLGLLLLAAAFCHAQTEDDCTGALFNKKTSVKDFKTIKLTQNKKEITLAAFRKANDMGANSLVALKDLDSDGKKELLIWNYTGGAHCCDEFYFFKNTGNNKYNLAAKLFAGNTCVDEDNTFSFDLHESFGYFFTCFACSLEEKAGTYSYVYSVQLKYKNGRLDINPGSIQLLETIKNNLHYIKSLGWDGGLKEADFDDGRRKAVALNLATFYFAFGKSLPNTKKLFQTYYQFKDASKVWTAFLENLNGIKSSNSF